MNHQHDWDIIVKPKSSALSLNLKEVWAYKDLIILMVKRDVTAIYKQTILGPLWMFIQPIFTTLIYTFTFSQARISTDGVPPLLFYLIGQTFWSYFSECLSKTSTTFISNAAVFGKVYFPRLVMPISVILSNLIRLAIQFVLLFVVYIYFFSKTDSIHLNLSYLFLIPVLIAILGLFSLSLGILFSSFTTKYRDFTFLLNFATQLIMFLSSVVFPVSMFHGIFKTLLLCNPVAVCMEAVKYILTGNGLFSVPHLVLSIATTLFLLLISIVVFNRTEKSFMDTV